MFQHENVGKMLSKLDLLQLKNNSNPQYHRGTLAAFLSFVKARTLVTHWDEVMDVFLTLVENDKSLLLGSNYLQELYLQLHLLGVHSTDILRQPLRRRNSASGWKCINAWKLIPTVVCVTLRIPRERLKVFTDLPWKELGTPPVHCELKSSPGNSLSNSWHNIFAAIQLSFGEITTCGLRDDEEFTIDVLEDPRGWHGTSPLLVSFYAPSWSISLEADATIVTFGILSTPNTSRQFAKILGRELNVYKTTLGDGKNVFITRHLPNQKGYPLICSSVNYEKANIESSSETVRSSVRVNLDRITGQIVTMTGRLDIIAEDIKSALKDGCQVQTAYISPCVVAVRLLKKQQQLLQFPAPVLRAGLKCRVARKSSYIEVEVQLTHSIGDDDLSHFISPTYINGLDPVLWNMPRLNLDCLPIFDTTKRKKMDWLINHMSYMWSARERTLRENTLSYGTIQKDVRVNLKDSLFSQFIDYTGLQGRHAKIFGINSPDSGGIQLLFFVSCLRLDLSNRTVVLDALVLPLTNQLVPTIKNFLAASTSRDICSITADDEELKLWKEMLPAYVERCRQWKHRPTCEYLSRSQIPLSLKTGEQVICSCGNGIVPEGIFSDIPLWNTISKHVVRVAISPLFTNPSTEPSHDITGLAEENLSARSSNTGCANCKKAESPKDGIKLQKCARCMTAKYCSVECQRADWGKHKKGCGK